MDVQNGRVLQAEGGWGKVRATEKKGLFQGWASSSGGVGDSRALILQCIRKFQTDSLKITFPEVAEVTIKSWFDVVRANQSIWGLLLLFFNRPHKIAKTGKLGAPGNSSPVPLM